MLPAWPHIVNKTKRRLFGGAVGDGDAERRLGFFGGVDFEGLRGFGGIVVAPEPDHFGGKFGSAVGGIVGSLPEAEMKIVVFGLERVGHAEIVERPIAIAEVEVFGTVLEPDADVAMRFTKNFFGKVLTAIGIGRIFFPLDRGEAADPGDDAAEFVRELPSGVEGGDSAG